MSVSAPGQLRPVTPLGIVAQRLGVALGLLREEERDRSVDGAIREALTGAWRIAAGLDSYLEQCASPESPTLRSVVEETRRTDWTQHSGSAPGALEQEMLSGHVEGQLLQMLVRATGARRVLEIGMFTGYSALALAEALPADGTVVACEIDAFAAEIAARCFSASPSGERIDVRLGPALDTISSLAQDGRCFDFVFIDAEKSGYRSYLDALLDLGLLTDDALVCVDNTLMQGQPWNGPSTANGESITKFNEFLSGDPRAEQVVLPIRDGLTLARWAEPRGGRQVSA